MADTDFDIIIIGSGPGGYVTAIRAAQLGLALYSLRRDTSNDVLELQREDVVGRPSRASIAGDRPSE